ncbi:hypothetical protein KIN20_029205 [Parelaphostrongylus tenuis]|uniref:RNA helicase n=1 Tax=Parelaphostrongylus tenuis TaxID=148309 RepID=A0AAD5WFF3_PARTN|nr:hypothetical protein KIN20_029205 [Parelaphostrongylus tenuis]
MERESLLVALKSGSYSLVKELLSSIDQSLWPVDVLIPFVLRNALQNLTGTAEIVYVANVFRMFSRLRRLSEAQRNEASELHRLALLAMSIQAMFKYRIDGDIDKLGDFVMRKYQDVVRSYGCRLYGAQFRYLVAVCHRRTRLYHFRRSNLSNVGHIRSLERYFDCVDDNVYIAKAVRSGDWEQKVIALNYFLDVVFDNPEAVIELDGILKHVNPKLWNETHLKQVDCDSPTFKLFMEKFFPEGEDELKMLDRCAAALEPEFFVASLAKLNNPYPELQSLRRENEHVNNVAIDDRDWAARILRTLPCLDRKTDDWFYDFVEACSKDPYNRAVLWYLFPNYEEVLENRLIEKRRRPPGKSVNDVDIIEDIPEITEMRKAVDFISFRSREFDEIQESERLVLRPYQEELVEMAVRGKSTIICAPTGCGKTEVGIYVAMCHLDEKAEKNEPARVAMLVPRIPLVDQQRQRFHKYVRGRYYVEGFHGTAQRAASRRDLVLACDIVVMTPQILLNMLKSIRKDERLYVCDFSLLIFDEVHHCIKDHPYNILMQTIHDYNGPKPQTMGLTASLGVGISTTEEAGMATVYELLANLGATTLSSVRRYTDILAQYVRKPADFTEKVDRPKSSPFMDMLISIMQKIEKSVEDQLNMLTTSNATGFRLSKEEVKFEHPLATEKYIQKINTLSSTLSRVSDGDFKFEPSIALEYLSILSQGIGINDLMPARYALEHLQSYLGALSRKFEVQCSKKYYKYFTEQLDYLTKSAEEELQKPIVAALEKELKNQFTLDANSRAIIFVTRRSTAVQLMNYLNREKVVMGNSRLVGFVTSTSKKSSEYGQTHDEQRRVLEDFNSGRKKVIVATSVVEEGLDVGTCNLIIKYNTSSTVVQRVQRRGRARALDSRSVLIVLSENVAQTEFQAIITERIMNKCISRVQEQGERALEKKVLEVMERQAKERRALTELRIKEREQLKDKLFTIRCKIDGKYTKQSIGKGKYVDDVTQILADISCSCGQMIGTVMKYASSYLPTLGIANLTFAERFEGKDLAPERIVTWSKASERFWIPEVNEKEMRQMLLSIMEENSEGKIDLDVMCDKIIATQRRMLEKERKKKEEAGRIKSTWD